MNNEERLIKIRERLTKVFSPQHLAVIDESDKHVGHKGHGGAGHFAIEISADSLKGLSRIEAHRKIYAALDELIPNEIHALRIRLI